MLYQKFLHFGVKMALKNGWVGLSNTVCFSPPFSFSLFIHSTVYQCSGGWQAEYGRVIDNESNLFPFCNPSLG